MRTVGEYVHRSDAEWLEIARGQSDRFWSKVQKKEPCWCWLGRCDKDGYGQFMVTGPYPFRPIQKGMRAHRVSWQYAYGPLSAEILLRHTCDVAWCVRPSHLIPGTQADNIRDMVSRNRQPRRLSPGDVLVIRSRRAGGETYRSIADSFGIGLETARAACLGITWAHLPAANVPQVMT